MTQTSPTLVFGSITPGAFGSLAIPSSAPYIAITIDRILRTMPRSSPQRA